MGVNAVITTISTDELFQVPLFDEVLYFLFEVIAVFSLVFNISVVQAVKARVPLFPLPVHFLRSTSEIVLLHHGEYTSSPSIQGG